MAYDTQNFCPSSAQRMLLTLGLEQWWAMEHKSVRRGAEEGTFFLLDNKKNYKTLGQQLKFIRPKKFKF